MLQLVGTVEKLMTKCTNSKFWKVWCTCWKTLHAYCVTFKLNDDTQELLEAFFPLMESHGIFFLVCGQACSWLQKRFCILLLLFFSHSVLSDSLQPHGPHGVCMPDFPVLYYFLEFAQTHIHLVGNAIRPSHPLLSPSSLAFNLSQHQGFSNELALHISWPKYWSFSFRISPPNEYSGLIFFRIDQFDLLAVQGTLRVFSNTVWKHQFFSAQHSLWSSLHIWTWSLEKP